MAQESASDTAQPGVAAGGPTFWVQYRLGARLSKHLEPVRTLEEIGAELGITRQNAYTEVVLALGKLALRLHAHFGVPVELQRPAGTDRRPRRRLRGARLSAR